jgi:hypothetical protein
MFRLKSSLFVAAARPGGNSDSGCPSSRLALGVNSCEITLNLTETLAWDLDERLFSIPKML